MNTGLLSMSWLDGVVVVVVVVVVVILSALY
jgi:hypothetical protein